MAEYDDISQKQAAERRRQLKMNFQPPSNFSLGSTSVSGNANTAAFQNLSMKPTVLMPSSRQSGDNSSTHSSASRSRTAAPVVRPFSQETFADKSSRFKLNIQSSGKLQISPDTVYDFTSEDLQDLGEIGRGAFGTVNKMVHRKSNTVMAVKGDCWICMELMDSSLDKFYKFIYENQRQRIPESILGKITVATVQALNYLKEKLKIIHRDVKPSNILLDKRGNIKLCDFGISGQLVDSIARTRDAGCRPYMAPERIDPQRARGYDVRSDVWSLGITLMEVATGHFPYPKWNSVFEQLYQVVQGDAPQLAPVHNGNHFTAEFVNFVNTCLIKEETQRPKYNRLLEHDFIKRSETERVDVAAYVCSVLDDMANNGITAFTTDQP
ncbi:Dual specificity mitogen-activated protein kinase kinase 4 [Frankliniella fusca]|uniref:mitogen-activated protein kinase kinase n=1 Tax=Frankliniella fusca TaxID=407009 RepID=A0AAE1HZE7_9NEOP|nr:Dual specificity mitogen-activated protein kinase kinase 4 [Frankliniella fusca]